MAVIKTNSEDVRVLARLMRAEAEEDGESGMLMVGNVGVNRILGNCLDFNNIRSVNDMVYQSPGGFEAPQRDISISGRGRLISGWRNERLTGSEPGRPRMRSGSSARSVIARRPGTISRIPDATRPTASSLRHREIVRQYTRQDKAIITL